MVTGWPGLMTRMGLFKRIASSVLAGLPIR